MTTINTSLLGMAGIFETMVRHAPAMHHSALERAGHLVEDEAKRVLGTYDYGWPSLSEATIAHKGGDTPGLETGEMRDSIYHTVSGNDVSIGSDLDRAIWFELGTRTQPPRSFLAAAVVHEHDHILHEMGQVVEWWLGGKVVTK